MNKQEIFNRVYAHLMTQGERSLSGNAGRMSCAYRGAGGLTCAVGCLIPDEAYYLGMEGGTVTAPKVMDVLIAVGVVDPSKVYTVPSLDVEGGHIYAGKVAELLRDLQIVHDNIPVEGWPNALAHAAYIHNLEVPS